MNDEDEGVAAPPPDWAQQLLAFWFEEHGMQDWFRGGPAFDAAVTERFAGWREALRSQPTEQFTTGADTALAAILLFDQVPRNAHRSSAEAFATDHAALAIARAGLAEGFDQGFDTDRRAFFYLPFEHSESIDDQRESVRLFTALGNDTYLEYAQKHFAVIDRFGRFPHRNAVLGRADRPGEAEAVAAGAHW